MESLSLSHSVEPRKVSFYVSPKIFKEYLFKGCGEVSNLTSRNLLIDVLDCAPSRFGFCLFLDKINNRLVFQATEENRYKHGHSEAFIEAATLPTDFFEKINKKAPIASNSRRLLKVAFKIQRNYFRMLVQDLWTRAFVPLMNIEKVTSELKLNLKPLSFEQYLSVRASNETPLNIDKVALNTCHKVLKQNFVFFREQIQPNSTAQGLKSIVVYKVGEEQAAYEVLSFKDLHFDCVKDLHKRMQKVFIKDYVGFILHNNLKQILEEEELQ